MPMVQIVFPWLVYLFYCSIQTNAGGDESTFAFAVTHHQNSSQGEISTVIYVNFVVPDYLVFRVALAFA